MASTYLTRTQTAGNQRTFTLSAWVKRSGLGVANQIMSFDRSGPRTEIAFNSDDKIACNFNPSGSSWSEFYSVGVFRDVGAWYHVVVSVDTTQGTDTNRLKIYVNGSLITFTGTLPSENFDTGWNVSGNVHAVGRYENGSSGYFNGYMAEVCWIDGTAYAASDFGEFDEDSPTIWKPKDVSALTFGTHGFYLDFEDSSNLGNDANGGTDLTEVNLAATDQATDTPTNNFNNFMSHTTSSYTTLSEGGLVLVGNNSGDDGHSLSGFGVTSGKWYYEIKLTTLNSGYPVHAWVKTTDVEYGHQSINGGSGNPSPRFYGFSASNTYDGSSATSNVSFTQGNILGVALDLDNGALYVSESGTFINSSDPTSGASKTNASVTWTPAGETYSVYCGSYNGSKGEFNFGSPPYANSSDAADGNGYGAFEYAPPSGYLALCTKNLGSDGG